MSKPIEEMNKDELRDFALSEHNIKLEMRKSIETLRQEVLKAGGKIENAVESSSGKIASTHLKNRETGLFWPRTRLLEERGDLIPCDENGNEV